MLDRTKKNILKKLIKSNIKENKVRNIVLTIAIAAVSVMLFTVAGAGVSYVKNFSEMNMRLKGTNAQGFIRNVSDEEKLKNVQEISDVGTQYFAGVAEDETSGSMVALSAYDKTEWEKNILPTIADFHGRVPKEENEILLSEKAREILGADAGSASIRLRIGENGAYVTKNFSIVGTYRDFIDSGMRSAGSISGNVLAAALSMGGADETLGANCIVSEKYAQEICTSSHIYHTFQIRDGKDIKKRIAAELGMKDTSNITITETTDGSGQYIGIILAIVICIAVCLCGYLCIYNIMNISLVKDIHFWGNMKAIGTDRAQLNYIADFETNYFVIRGAPIGIALGTVLTLKFVPLLLKTAVGSGGFAEIMPFKMHYSMVLLLLTVLFCYVTVFVSFRKAIRFLAKLTPVEAMRFNGEIEIRGGKKKTQKRCHGRLYKMAWNNVYSEKKRFFMVIATLFMGLFIFLLSYTMFASPNWELYLDREAPNDFGMTDYAVIDQVVTDGEASRQQLTEDTYEKLRRLYGVQEIEKTYLLPVSIRYFTDLSDYSEDRQDLFGSAVGISTNVLRRYKLWNGKDYSESEIAGFEDGENVYINAAGSGKCPDLAGKIVSIRNKDTKEEQSYKIAGILKPTHGEDKFDPQELGPTTDPDYLEMEKMRIFMSGRGIRKLAADPAIYDIEINVQDEKETLIKEEIDSIVDSSIQVISRSDLLPTYQPVAQSIVIIGTVFSCILLVIGLMNFVNSLCTRVYARRKELAVLSGIGMSKRQVITMLGMEGSYYALITMGLLGTLGIGMIYLLMTVSKEQLYFLEFTVPVKALVCLLVLLLAICFLTPFFVYKNVSRSSIVDRLKSSEE